MSWPVSSTHLKLQFGNLTPDAVSRASQVTLEEAQAHGPSHMLPATYANPLGRASITRPTPAMFERASVVCLHPKPQTLTLQPCCPWFCQHVCSGGISNTGRCAMLIAMLIAN